MAGNWTHLRVPSGLKADLERWAREHGMELGRDWAPGKDGWVVPLHAVIRVLLTRDEAHRERAERQTQRRKKGKAADAVQGGAQDGAAV